MRAGTLESGDIYAALDRCGLHYGPAHRGIATIDRGEGQLLAQLRLPQLVVSNGAESDGQEYVLHPGVMDSAVQALVGLTGNLRLLPEKPLMPFALEHLHVAAGCVRDMVAWVRYSPGRPPRSDVISVDVDLCDQEGNVCVQMRGLACRLFNERAASLTRGVSNPSFDAEVVDDGEEVESDGFDVPFDSRFYQTLIERVAGKEISVDEALEWE